MSLNILDTGDNYILAYNNYLYNDAVKLYELMDISVNTIPTNLNISKDTIDFIFSSIGRVISYGFMDNNDLLSKLLIDIQKTSEYYKIKEFWEGLQYPCQKKKYNNESDLSYDSYAILKQESKIDENMKIVLNNISKDYNNSFKSNVYIVYNTIYNISLVIDETVTKNIDQLNKFFPEFILVKTINDTLITNSKDKLLQLFHKVSFNTLTDVTNKIDAFYKLYDIPIDINSKDIKEKKRVKDFLDWNYVLSTDVDKKMKANDLYKEVINHLCISIDDSAAFKKRLAGYLLEFNLQKKRYSDAYYYYGIEKKEVSSVSLTDLEEKRALDKTEWFQTLPRINRLEPISTRKDYNDITSVLPFFNPK